jgi:uncharacterized protein with von Willebrand factor type A (vWA) domain
MLRALEGLVTELREVGMNISTTEMLDAARALRELPLEDREIVKEALSTVLVKEFEHFKTYETIFDIYFSPRRMPNSPFQDDEDGPSRGGRLSDMSDEELKERMQDAVESGDETMMRKLASLAVERHANIESGRAVAGVFYRMRTLRALNLKEMREQILAEGEEQDDEAADDSPFPRLDKDLERRLREEEVDMRLAELQKEVESDIRRRLVEDRGAEAVAKTLKAPLPEDAEFLHASNLQIAEMRETLGPLTAKLATALAEKRKHKRRGSLDFRRTMRSSMTNGGVPLDLYFHDPKPTKPDLVVLADISGSVARFAAFTLQLLYALRGEFAKLRSFVFADGMDEVTELMATAKDIAELTATINEKGLGVWLNGSSDYGHALQVFHEEHLESIGSRSTVILLGDARNNDKAAHLDDFEKIAKRAKHMFWLNPEPRKDWDTGDSILSRYGQYCEGIYECRNLRQLRDFVEKLD